jgi:hypothetical protein
VGKIYLIFNGAGQYKIGYTQRDPEQRLMELQTGNPETLMIIKTYKSSKAHEIEKILHRKYQIYKTQGEWFELPPKEIPQFQENCALIESSLILLENNKIGL